MPQATAMFVSPNVICVQGVARKYVARPSRFRELRSTDYPVWDAAGIVRAVGSEVTLFRPGDEVFYAGSGDRPGSYAEFQCVDERIVGHKPKNVDFAESVAMPLTTITAWEMLFDRLKIDRMRRRIHRDPTGSGANQAQSHCYGFALGDKRLVSGRSIGKIVLAGF